MPVAVQLRLNKLAIARIGSEEARKQVTRATLAVLTRAQIITPVDTGNLRRNNQMRVFRRRATTWVGEVYNPASYARPVHDGTGPRVIRPRRKKALRFTVGGETVIVKRVQFPGTMGRPWLRRALEEVAPQYGFRVVPSL